MKNLNLNAFAMKGLALTLGGFVWIQPADAAWIVKQYRAGDSVKIQSVAPSPSEDPQAPQVIRSIPAAIAEHQESASTIYEEILYPQNALPPELRPLIQATVLRPAWPGSEVRTLIQQGPNENRINLTIVGDGYQAAEREKFFADAERITRDMFTGKTFASYLPLFNVHAVFVPSRDSGISDTSRKNTALGLYRDPPGSKRAIMPGNVSKARQAVELAPATDYPILIANDDFYGGLGGEFAISTRSELSGTLVLRHELGHNFGDVGEEYDGGQVYRGANFSPSPGAAGWKHWSSQGSVSASKATYLSGQYLWKNLSGSPIRVRFNFPSATSQGSPRFQIDISTVGWESPEDVHVKIDGQKMNLVGSFTDDRSFFTLEMNQSLAPGPHTLEFAENIADGDNVLAFANLYALDASYDTKSGAVGAYPVFTAPGNLAGYRPTHNRCLMREMRSEGFCEADQENMWIRFLARVSLIDEVTRQAEKVVLKTPALEGLQIRWFKRGASGGETELTQLRDLREWQPAAGETGRYRVEVKFRTPEVRAYNLRFDVQKEFSL